MKKQQVKNQIYSGLSKYLSPLNFRLNKGEGAFSRPTPTGFQKVYIPLIDYNPQFIFSLTVAIRLDSVEEIFNLFSGADEKGQKQTTTVLTQLSFFTEGKKENYPVSSEKDIDTALLELGEFIESKIVPYLDVYQNVTSVDAAMNVQRLKNFDSSILVSHAMHSVILAKLSDNDRFDELVREYDIALKQYNQFDRDRYTGLISYLGKL